MHRLTRSPYTHLPKEAESLWVDSLQDMSLSCPLSFRKLGNSKRLPCLMGCELGPHLSLSETVGRVSCEVVSAVLPFSHGWEEGAKLLYSAVQGYVYDCSNPLASA